MSCQVISALVPAQVLRAWLYVLCGWDWFTQVFLNSIIAVLFCNCILWFHQLYFVQMYFLVIWLLQICSPTQLYFVISSTVLCAKFALQMYFLVIQLLMASRSAHSRGLCASCGWGWFTRIGHCQCFYGYLFGVRLTLMFTTVRSRWIVGLSTSAPRFMCFAWVGQVNSFKYNILLFDVNVDVYKGTPPKKRMFSFGHCPNYPSSPPPLSGNLYIFFGRQR